MFLQSEKLSVYVSLVLHFSFSKAGIMFYLGIYFGSTVIDTKPSTCMLAYGVNSSAYGMNN